MESFIPFWYGNNKLSYLAIRGERKTYMKIFNVHYAMNGEEHDYVIEAMSESDALTSCWCENAVCEEGEETYIVLWCDELPDCEENRKLCRRMEV